MLKKKYISAVIIYERIKDVLRIWDMRFCQMDEIEIHMDEKEVSFRSARGTITYKRNQL